MTSPAFASPLAAEAPRADWRRTAFLRTFNLKTVAAMFYIALAIAICGSPWWAIDGSLESALFFLGYITRQTLASAMAVLLAMALAEAALPRTLPRALRYGCAAAFIAAGAFASTILRMAMARGDAARMSGFDYLTWVLYVGLIWTAVGLLAYAILDALREDDAALLALEEARCEEAKLEAQMVEAHLSALQAQIEPHFLFNTLANVRRLYEVNVERGEQMLRHLLDYLRAALPSMRSATSTLGRELDLVRSYLTILQLRMGERLQFAVDAGAAPAAAALPPMVLPTLVENAVKHGLSPVPAGGSVTVRARCEQAQRTAQLVIEVADTGRGFVGASGSGVGLANIRARLAALHGAAAGLQLRANHPSGVVAEVRLPLTLAPAAAEPAP